MGASPHFPDMYLVASEDDRVREACRMLTVGEAAPGKAEQAIGLLHAGMAAGSGAAAERLAVMAALGIGRSSSWTDAMNLLVRSAQMGYGPAQGQLAVLAGITDTASLQGGRDLWINIATRIDLKSHLRAPSLEKTMEKPSIALISGMATRAMCTWLIGRGRLKVTRARIGDYRTGQWVEDPVRTGEAAGYGIADTDLILALTQKRLELASGLHVRQQEAPHILSYTEGQEYKAHYDFLLADEPAFRQLLDRMGQRVATCLTWLNEDFEGGQTSFPKVGWMYRGKAGDGMLFLNVRPTDRQPDSLSLHAGLPVLQGRKWLLSQWVRDRAQPVV
jgi:prolyl 4-hydroxylase